MKLDKIPLDIISKSIKEAQNEIKEIITKLENEDTDLKDSIEHYNKMMYLNLHIQEKFKEKTNEIKNTSLNKNNKIYVKDVK